MCICMSYLHSAKYNGDTPGKDMCESECGWDTQWRMLWSIRARTIVSFGLQQPRHTGSWMMEATKQPKRFNQSRQEGTHQD